MKNLLSAIFSITDYGETHKVLCILGIKIKFPKREYALRKKQSPYYYYKNNNIDITTLPPAVGQIRDIQLANLELLKVFDNVCRKNGLEYWLDYGSLLGAVRHKGFIPWDDDIDVGMIRTDYENVIDIFNRCVGDSDIYAAYCRDRNNNLIIKIKHKKSDYVFVDIFPFDLCTQAIMDKNPLKTTARIKKMCKKLAKDNANSSLDELKEKYETMREEIFTTYKDAENKYIMRGVEFCGFPKNWFYKYETIYPLKTIEFEGYNFSCLNNTEEFLTNLYGNYMAYPKKIGVGHTACITIDEKDLEMIKKIAIEKECV